ncbi:hypothetical protein Hanom_Chr12g01132581 [Helianthus anomalus]
MKTKRQFRCWRIFEILKTFDTADALLLLSSSLSEPTVGDRGIHGVILSDSSRNRALSFLIDDNNERVTRLSAYAVTQAFPADWRGQCSIVYQRRRRGSCATLRADTPTGVHMVAPATDDVEGANPWVVDPHPLSEFGEVLHTPLGMLDMFPVV